MRTIQYESHATHEFAWNPEGTLARWTDPNADYERVFSYDEEGRLTKIERDDGQKGHGLLAQPPCGANHSMREIRVEFKFFRHLPADYAIQDRDDWGAFHR